MLDKLQKLSKEVGKDDTKLRNFAAKLHRLDAAVQPQQSTRSAETKEGCGGCQEGQARSEEFDSMTREGLYHSGADKRLRCRAA